MTSKLHVLKYCSECNKTNNFISFTKEKKRLLNRIKIEIISKIYSAEENWMKFNKTISYFLPLAVRRRDCLPAPNKEDTPCTEGLTSLSRIGPIRWHIFSRWSDEIWWFICTCKQSQLQTIQSIVLDKLNVHRSFDDIPLYWLSFSVICMNMLILKTHRMILNFFYQILHVLKFCLSKFCNKV